MDIKLILQLALLVKSVKFRILCANNFIYHSTGKQSPRKTMTKQRHEEHAKKIKRGVQEKRTPIRLSEKNRSLDLASDKFASKTRHAPFAPTRPPLLRCM